MSTSETVSVTESTDESSATAFAAGVATKTAADAEAQADTAAAQAEGAQVEAAGAREQASQAAGAAYDAQAAVEQLRADQDARHAAIMDAIGALAAAPPAEPVDDLSPEPVTSEDKAAAKGDSKESSGSGNASKDTGGSTSDSEPKRYGSNRWFGGR